MRAAVTDRRILTPPATQWGLTGGAELIDPETIRMSAVNAVAAIWIPCAGRVTRLTVRPAAYVPSGGDNRRFLSAKYFAADRVTEVAPTLPTSGNAPIVTPDVWGSTGWELRPGPLVHWVRLWATVQAAYGVPGTLYRPDAAMLTVTYG